MRFLRVLGLVFIDARAVRDVVLAIAIRDGIARRRHSFGRHVDPVRPHVSNVSRLIEPLGTLHRLARAKAKLSAGFLLQRGRHKRRRRVPRARLCLDRLHLQIARLDRLHGQVGSLRRRDIEFFELLAAKHRQTRFIGLAPRRAQGGLYGPVFLRGERLDLHLALNDQAEADGLNAARRASAWQFAP